MVGDEPGLRRSERGCPGFIVRKDPRKEDACLIALSTVISYLKTKYGCDSRNKDAFQVIAVSVSLRATQKIANISDTV
jgi:hypothetical protein